MPSLPPPIKGELFYDGVWNSASVRTTSDIEITRGLSSESSTAADPMTCECDLESGSAMLYAPRNPMSPLFGKIGRNTPFRLSLQAGGPFLDCPGSGVYSFNTPDNNAYDFAGDIDIRIDVRPDDWTNPQALTMRYTPGSVAHSFAMGQDGSLYFWWSDSGTKYAKSTGLTNFANGERNVLRVTLDVDNGASGWTCRFWHAKSIDADEWTMIGDPVTGTGSGGTTTTRPIVAAPLYIADNQLSLLPDSSSGFSRFSGEIYGFQMWNGFNDQLVVDLDTARDGGEAAVGGTTLVDATGFTWTRSGVSTLSNQYYRMVGEVPSWPPTRDLTGNAVYTSIAPTGITRRMDAGNKPQDSALLRWLSRETPTACWPMTDGSNLQEGYSLTGGTPIASDLAGDGVSVGSFGKDQLVDWVEPIYQTPSNQDNVLTGLLPRDTSLDWAFDMIFRLSGPLQPFSQFNLTDEGAGTTASPQVQLSFVFVGDDSPSTGQWVASTWTYVDDGGSSIGQIWSPNFPAAQLFDGEPHHFRVQGTDNGSSVTVDLYLDGVFMESGTVPFTMKPLRKVEYAMIYTTLGTDTAQQSAGFLTYWGGNNGIATASEYYDAFQGFPGELASERMSRLASESNYTFSSSGDPEDEATLSLQERAKLLQLMQDASDANFGYLLERRDELEIYHRGQSMLWNQAPAITLDFTDGVIGAPFKPVDDDKLTQNDVTVKGKRFGSPARYVLEEGELSVQDFPDGVGRYDEEFEFILDTNLGIQAAAYMKLHMGTYNGVRYTRITLDLANKRVYKMLHKILRADVGDKIRLLNIPLDHGPGPVDVIIQGYTETIGESEWSITFNCVPGEPWTAGQVYLDGETNSQSRLDTAGCVTGGTATTTSTQVDLYTTKEFEWTSDLFDSPYDVRVGGEVMTVLGPGGPINANALFDTSISPWVSQNGSSVWSDDVVHPDPRAKGSLKFTPSGGFSAGGPLSELSAVGTIIPGVAYSIGAWVYSVNGLADFRAVADWYDSAGTYLSTSGATLVVGTARKWVWVGATPIAPASASRYRIRIRYGVAAGTSDVYYVWAARLTLASAATVRDTFSRTLSDTWGSAETGQAWTNSGGSSTDFDTTGSAGTVTVTSANVSRYSVIPATHVDQDVRLNVSTSALATGASQYAGPVARYIDANNTYYGRIAFQTNQSVSLTIQKRVGGTQTDLVTVTLPWTHAINTVFGVRLCVQGSTLRARAWPVATVTEPRIWHAQVTDTSLAAAGSVGIRTITGSGNTNTNPVFSYDNFETVSNQRFSVTRSENNVIKSHVVNEDARLAIPSYVQM